MKSHILSLVIVCALTSSGAARADEAAESYAVVTLVGDALSVVSYHPSVGSYIDQNVTQQVPLDDTHFDQLATRVTLDAVHRAAPTATLQGLDLPDRAKFANSDALLSADGTLPALLAAVKPLLAQPRTHYLIVVSKHRGDARLDVANGKIGSGKLRGLGFYVDAGKRMKKSATGDVGRGFVSPYAYVQVSLVDLATSAVVRFETDEESTTRANANGDATLDPWQAIPADEKIHLLDNLLGRALHKTVPRVVAPS